MALIVSRDIWFSEAAPLPLSVGPIGQALQKFRGPGQCVVFVDQNAVHVGEPALGGGPHSAPGVAQSVVEWGSSAAVCSQRSAARPRIRPSSTSASNVTNSSTVVLAAAWKAWPRSVRPKIVTGRVFQVAG